MLCVKLFVMLGRKWLVCIDMFMCRLGLMMVSVVVLFVCRLGLFVCSRVVVGVLGLVSMCSLVCGVMVLVLCVVWMVVFILCMVLFRLNVVWVLIYCWLDGLLCLVSIGSSVLCLKFSGISQLVLSVLVMCRRWWYVCLWIIVLLNVWLQCVLNGVFMVVMGGVMVVRCVCFFIIQFVWKFYQCNDENVVLKLVFVSVLIVVLFMLGVYVRKWMVLVFLCMLVINVC